MSIKITATSTCDLPAELVERHQITLVPLYVSYGGGTYRDGVDTGPEDIFRHVEEGGPLPSTSAVNIADYQALFAELSPEYDHVLHITIGSDFSCCYQNALVAAADYPNVHVVDSQNLTVGQGLLVLEAALAAERGASLDEILALLEALTAILSGQGGPLLLGGGPGGQSAEAEALHRAGGRQNDRGQEVPGGLRQGAGRLRAGPAHREGCEPGPDLRGAHPLRPRHSRVRVRHGAPVRVP